MAAPTLAERFASWRQAWNTAGANSLVPQRRFSGPMPWVIAIMVALTVIAAAAGLGLSKVAGAATDELSGGVTIQVIEANPDLRRRQAATLAARLAQVPGVSAVHVVPEDEVDRLIEPWLGTSLEGDDAIPVPALIDARVNGKLDGERLGALRRLAREIAPSARVDAQSTWLRPVFGAIESLQWLVLALLALLAFATSAVVLLSVRTALGTHRNTIEIVHLLGGADQQIARVFQRSAGLDAAAGGLLGLIAGATAVWFLGQRFSGLGAGLVSSGALQTADWLLLALIPVAGVALAVITARITVLRTLRQML